MAIYEDTVESEISIQFYANMLFRYIFFIAIVWPGVSFIGASGPLLVIAAFVIFIAVHVYLIITGFIIQIIVSPDDLTIDYLFKERRVIDYKEIESIGNFKGAYGWRSAGARHTENITLKDGTEIVFSDQKFENYIDLKNHIYRYMVDTNQAAQGQ